MNSLKSFTQTLNGESRLPFAIVLLMLLAVMVLIGLTVVAMLNFPTHPAYPDSAAIIEEQSFGPYVGLVNNITEFLTTIIGILIVALLLTVGLLGAQMYLWNKDRRRLSNWQNSGLVIERLEFLSGNRLRLNGTEIELNRAQYTTLTELVTKRLAGEPLHPGDLPGDNGTQMIKRLREELGGRLIEQSFIKSRRGKGYWAEIDPENIRFKTGD